MLRSFWLVIIWSLDQVGKAIEGPQASPLVDMRQPEFVSFGDASSYSVNTKKKEGWGCILPMACRLKRFRRAEVRQFSGRDSSY